MLIPAKLLAMPDAELQNELEKREEARTKVPPAFTVTSGQNAEEIKQIKKAQRVKKINKLLGESENNSTK
jgi:hypothetical protein